MATTSLDYTVVGSSATVAVLSQTQVADVERVMIYTEPSKVLLNVNVPLKAFEAGNEGPYLAAPAGIIEGLFTEGLVSDAWQVQAQGPNRLLVDFVDFMVNYTQTSGLGLPFTTIVRIPMSALASREAYATYAATAPHKEPIVTAYNRLVSLAGGPDSAKV